MRKLILKCDLSLGDIVLLTAAVRDLHRCYPRQFVTDVRTFFPQMWENNPYITQICDEDPAAELIKCTYPLIDFSNERPYHCIHGFIDFLNAKLNLRVKPTAFKGDLHLSAQEKAWFSQVHELTGENTPFWIVAAGGKYDLTIKWWDTNRYQEVIDAFRGKIQFVQVGAAGHHHPKLEGTIDLRGRTTPRELIRLIYHSQGVLCSVTGIMHLAAAIETKSRRWTTRPCVVVAGGREPAHWESYPGHQFIHTNGALACGGQGGCWKDRVVPLRDGDQRDSLQNLCVDVVGALPRCMDMISSAEVVRRIQLYFTGGRAKYLTADQRPAAEQGARASQRNDYDQQPLTLHNAGLACDSFVETIPSYPERFRGRGIVICGGGVRYFTAAWVCINMLRDLGCKLPIEFWHLGAEEMDAKMAELLEALGVRCVDALQIRKRFPIRRLKGWELKPYAILHSSFKEVLLLDADNVPVVNPEFLFDSTQFMRTAAIFWPDYDGPKHKKARTIWRSCGLRQPSESEFETGQILVDKERCWSALCLTLWLNENSDFYYQYIHGDKETFHLAFRKLKQPYHLVQTPIKSLEGTMCQHDFEGRRIFQHRNSDKWDLFLRNPRTEGFLFDEECRAHVRRLQKLWDGRAGSQGPSIRVQTVCPREVKMQPVMVSNKRREGLRAATLSNFQKTDWDGLAIEVHLFEAEANELVRKQNDCVYQALTSALESDSDYCLFLEDDLIFNQFLGYNLKNWAPLREGMVGLASLYNPTIRELACDLQNNARQVDPGCVFGSQAFLIAKPVLQHILRRWNKVEGTHDIKMSRLASRRCKTILYHAPSLVQHIDPAKERGGIYDRAMDFDAEWRATHLQKRRNNRCVPRQTLIEQDCARPSVPALMQERRNLYTNGSRPLI